MMETTIRVMAWIGLGTATVLGVATAIVWADRLLTWVSAKGMNSARVIRACSFWLGMEFRGKNAAWIATQLHERFRLMEKENPAIAEEFKRLITKEEPC